jgi:hypothetical protein
MADPAILAPRHALKLVRGAYALTVRRVSGPRARSQGARRVIRAANPFLDPQPTSSRRPSRDMYPVLA